MMLMSSEAGRSFNMLDKTEEPSYVCPKLDGDVDGERWRDRVSQYKGKLSMTK